MNLKYSYLNNTNGRIISRKSTLDNINNIIQALVKKNLKFIYCKVDDYNFSLVNKLKEYNITEKELNGFFATNTVKEHHNIYSDEKFYCCIIETENGKIESVDIVYGKEKFIGFAFLKTQILNKDLFNEFLIHTENYGVVTNSEYLLLINYSVDKATEILKISKNNIQNFVTIGDKYKSIIWLFLATATKEEMEFLQQIKNPKRGAKANNDVEKIENTNDMENLEEII